MPLTDTDMFLVGRGNENFSCTASQISEFVAQGFTGDVVIDGVTLTFTNGLLTNVQ